jgi:hypothetical protein
LSRGGVLQGIFPAFPLVVIKVAVFVATLFEPNPKPEEEVPRLFFLAIIFAFVGVTSEATTSAFKINLSISEIIYSTGDEKVRIQEKGNRNEV